MITNWLADPQGIALLRSGKCHKASFSLICYHPKGRVFSAFLGHHSYVCFAEMSRGTCF